jgi:hypothetical protein
MPANTILAMNAVWTGLNTLYTSYTQIEERTLRSEDSLSKIGVLPAEKLCHNFEQSINKYK